MDTHKRDRVNGTLTVRGFVPHLKMRDSEGRFFDAPVKVYEADVAGFARGEATRSKWEPVIRGGFLVFALPGGGEILDPSLPPSYLKGGTDL